MGDRNCAPKRRICQIEDEPRPKRIRKQVERYGIVTPSVIPTRRTIETRTLRSHTAERTRRTVRTRNVSSKKPIKEEIEEKDEPEEKEEKEEIEEIKVEEETETSLELCDLSEEVLLLILERIPAFGLINLSKTSKQFNRLCALDTIWKQRCRVSAFSLFLPF